MRKWVYWPIMGLLLVGISCQRAPQKSCNPPCRYGAPCIEGICQCPLPFEGVACEQDSRDRFVGTWEGKRICGDIRSGLRYFLWRDDSLMLYMFVAGSFLSTAYETLQVRLVDPFKLYMPPQTLRDTTVLVSGYGEQRRDSLYFELRMQGAGPRVDTCFWALKRR
ncbi:MAG: hypothetical protein ABDH66_03440 [Bacteroidia bacterium]